MSLARQLLTVLTGFLSGACLIATFFLTLQRVLTVPSTHPLLLAEEQQALVLPTALSLSPDGESLSIVPTIVENNNWSVTAQGVSLLTTPQIRPSPILEQGHGYILYGHNWPNLLGTLKNTRLGDTLTIEYSDHSRTSYTVESMFTVHPDRLDVLQLAQDPNSLLVYTCIGWMDRERLVVLAKKVAAPETSPTILSQIP